MKIVYSKEFAKEFKKLPASIQRLYHKQEDIFKENWRDPRLKVKKLKDHPLPFSFRSLADIACCSCSSNRILRCLPP
jgi:mRNA-degrading endonuclease RelE of RelBE toxin-antitoxin system